jgi:hypothetical protein
LTQITITLPDRRITRHFSHIGLTLALTFTVSFWLERGHWHPVPAHPWEMVVAAAAVCTRKQKRVRRKRLG